MKKQCAPNEQAPGGESPRRKSRPETSALEFTHYFNCYNNQWHHQSLSGWTAVLVFRFVRGWTGRLSGNCDNCYVGGIRQIL